MRAAGLLLFAAGLGILPGCSGDSGTQPGASAFQLALTVQPGSSAQSGAVLSPQPVVQLQDVQGNPVALRNKVVLVELAALGGTLSGTLQAKTDDAGRASFTDLGIVGLVGPRRLRFDSPGLRSVTSAVIQLAAGAAVSLTPVAGDLQTAAAGSAVAVAPSVRVSDAAGNPIAGVAVSFVASTGGTVDGGTTLTGSDGTAAPQRWTLSSVVGLNTLTATSPLLPGVSLAFTATGTVGLPALLSVSAGEGQSATVGANTPVAPAVLLTDAAGHPLEGVSITFTVASGGGSISGATPLTDATGVATLGSWTLGLPPGPNTLTVTRTGVPPLTLHATGIDFKIQTLSAGAASSCALDLNGKAYCWGSNGSGQIGNGNTVDVRAPTAVNGGLTFGSISAGAGHACGLLVNGDAYCWGANDAGQLGDASLLQRTFPVAVAGGIKFSAIRTGAGFTCGLRLDGAAFCWGVGTGGQLGDGTLVSKSVPTAVAGGHSFSVLTSGASHACGIDLGGAAWCWGSNGSGRLGDGTTTTRSSPAAVSGGLQFAAISAGGAYTCAIA
ncbi:MAG TPA: hypothetical protein VL241_02290, partial [Gemmatimonadales bacterium]|nr:hypothetical protein [Gemmatimonadales bacterium]